MFCRFKKSLRRYITDFTLHERQALKGRNHAIRYLITGLSKKSQVKKQSRQGQKFGRKHIPLKTCRQVCNIVSVLHT
jgi:hypothetical protein